MPDTRLLLLGPPAFERDGRAVAVTSHKAVALVGYLAAAGTPVPREWLQDHEEEQGWLTRRLQELRR